MQYGTVITQKRYKQDQGLKPEKKRMEKSSKLNRVLLDGALPLSKLKFVHYLRALKTQFRQFYKRCTCSSGSGTGNGDPNPNNVTSKTRDEEQSWDLSEQFAETGGVANNTARIRTTCGVSQSNGVLADLLDGDSSCSIRYSPNELPYWFHKWEAGIGLNLILPSPPPTPVPVSITNSTLRSSRPDGDFLLKVIIPAPLQFQDPIINSSTSRESRSRIPSTIFHGRRRYTKHRNPICEQLHRQQQQQNNSFRLCHAISDTSIQGNIRYVPVPASSAGTGSVTRGRGIPTGVSLTTVPDDTRLLSIPALHYSAYSKYIASSLSSNSRSIPRRPRSHIRFRYTTFDKNSNNNNTSSKTKVNAATSRIISRQNSSSWLKGSFLHASSPLNCCANNFDKINRSRNIQFQYSNNRYRNTFDYSNSNCSSNVIWRDLPKSISLNINSGYVESMFIPSWSENPLRKAPFFSKIKLVVNWAALNLRNERIEFKRKKQEELDRSVLISKKNIWNLRRRVGWMKRHLMEEKRIRNVEISGDVCSRFQFIHWLNENHTHINSVGRFFDIQDKRVVAIKIIPDKVLPSVVDHLKLKMGALREIKTLIRLDHLNIVQILTYFEHGNKIHVVFEACDHSLRCELSCASQGVHPMVAHGVIHQIILGLDHCHTKSYLHRNLCPENILVTVDGTVKIGDFSKAIYLKKSSSRREPCSPGTVTYGAPELLALDPYYDESADIWSLGCILVELLRGKVLWDGTTSEKQLCLIHKAVGPLLPHHAEVAIIKDEGEPPVKCLCKYFPEPAGEVYSFIEKCFEVDPSKRLSCKGLLDHEYIKLGNSEKWKLTDLMIRFDDDLPIIDTEFEFFLLVLNFVDSEQACQPDETTTTTTLPRFALWELRPHTVPLLPCSSIDITMPSIDSEKNKDLSSSRHNKENGAGNENENDLEDLASADSKSHKMRTATAVMKPKASVVFSSELVSESKLDGCILRARRCTPTPPVLSRPQEFANVKNQLNGMDYKSLWQCFQSAEISAPRAFSHTLNEVSPLRKANELRKFAKECRRPFESLMNSGSGDLQIVRPTNLCETFICHDADSFKNGLPTGPRSRMQYIINVLPQANWSTVQLFTTYLNQSAKKNSKTFCQYLGALITTLLDQIGDSKSKVAGPAIRILNNICESKGELFEPEAERIMESMLNKLGGPSFIEKEGNEVLKHLVNSLKPTKAILSLIKFGANHKTAASRQTTIILVHESVKKLELIPAFGLPGEQNSSQRRLSTAVFDISTRFLRDSNPHTRLTARDIYQHLMSHPGFWYLYQSAVPEEKRQWVNRLLEEIRRCQIIAKKNLKP